MGLANKYRPQTFAQVAGQDLVKTVLSRAALEDRPANAYLFSGTRGVGKTTVARIFAKALNCQHAPTAEPCNSCAQCERITRGSHVDVTEIDGASNNGVEDARALRENIGYAPMEGRYKVFIIDEAHMLSRSAFNALLKTLEEPPPRVVFIFATTEAHRFPATIISRCQHFIFRHLDDQAIAAHLKNVIEEEKIPHEQAALNLLAQRAAGSVRDAMSLLDQTLALGNGDLDAALCRNVLGLAGMELHHKILASVLDADCAGIITSVRQLFSQGLDIGFFMREMAANLRNFFLLRKGGAGLAKKLGLGPDEEKFCRLAQSFSPAHLHACWQMALEAQRNVTRSPEPASALELLLLNMAFLPELLPVERVSQAVRKESKGASTAESMETTAASAPAPAPYAGEPAAGPNSPLASPLRGDRASDNQESSREVHHATAPFDKGAFQWKDFARFFLAGAYGPAIPATHLLRSIDASVASSVLEIRPASLTAQECLEGREADLRKALADFCGRTDLDVRIIPMPPAMNEAELIKHFSERPELGSCLEILGAKITHCKPVAPERATQRRKNAEHE